MSDAPLLTKDTDRQMVALLTSMDRRLEILTRTFSASLGSGVQAHTTKEDFSALAAKTNQKQNDEALFRKRQLQADKDAQLQRLLERRRESERFRDAFLDGVVSAITGRQATTVKAFLGPLNLITSAINDATGGDVVRDLLRWFQKGPDSMEKRRERKLQDKLRKEKGKRSPSEGDVAAMPEMQGTGFLYVGKVIEESKKEQKGILCGLLEKLGSVGGFISGKLLALKLFASTVLLPKLLALLKKIALKLGLKALLGKLALFKGAVLGKVLALKAAVAGKLVLLKAAVAGKVLALKAAVAGIGSKIALLGPKLAGIGTTIGNKVALLGPKIASLGPKLAGIGTTIGSKVALLGPKIASLGPAILGLLKGAGGAIAGAGGAIVSGAKALAPKVGGMLAGAGSAVKKFLPGVGMAVSGGMMVGDGVAAVAKEWGASDTGSFIGGFLGGTKSGIEGAFANMGKWAGMGASIGFKVLGPVGSLIGGLIGGALGAIFGFIGGENIAKAMDAIGKFFLMVWEGIVDFFKKLPGRIWSGIQAIGRFFGSIGTWLWENAFKPALDWFGGLFSKIGSGISSLVGWVTGTLLPSIGNFFQSLFSGAMSGLGSIASWAKTNLLDPIVRFIRPIFRNFFDGIANVLYNASGFASIIGQTGHKRDAAKKQLESATGQADARRLLQLFNIDVDERSEILTLERHLYELQKSRRVDINELWNVGTIEARERQRRLAAEADTVNDAIYHPSTGRMINFDKNDLVVFAQQGKVGGAGGGGVLEVLKAILEAINKKELCPTIQVAPSVAYDPNNLRLNTAGGLN